MNYIEIDICKETKAALTYDTQNIRLINCE